MRLLMHHTPSSPHTFLGPHSPSPSLPLPCIGYRLPGSIMYRFITSITSSRHWSGRQLITHRTCDAAIPHPRVDPKKTRALKDARTARIMAALGPTAKTQKQPECRGPERG